MQVAFVSILDHQDLEHARQAQERSPREENEADPAPAFLIPEHDVGLVNPRQHLARSACNAPNNENANGDQREKLNYCLNRDGDDNAVVAFVGIKVTGAENHGKDRQTDRDPEGSEVEIVLRPVNAFGLREDCERQCHRLQLQRDIRHGRDHRDHGYDYTQLCRLPKPR